MINNNIEFTNFGNSYNSNSPESTSPKKRKLETVVSDENGLKTPQKQKQLRIEKINFNSLSNNSIEINNKNLAASNFSKIESHIDRNNDKTPPTPRKLQIKKINFNNLSNNSIKINNINVEATDFSKIEPHGDIKEPKTPEKPKKLQIKKINFNNLSNNSIKINNINVEATDFSKIESHGDIKEPKTPEKPKKLTIKKINFNNLSNNSIKINNINLEATDFSKIGSHVEGNGRNEPVTPQKQMKSRIQKISFNNLSNNLLKINNVNVDLSVYSKIGSYMDVFTFSAPINVINNIENENLVVKLHNKKIQNKMNETTRSEILKNSIENYEMAKKMAINVAEIYNHKTASTDHFILQEKINQGINVNDPKHISAVREMFFKSLQSKQSFDLMPSNIRVKEDGTVVLIDFLEEPEPISKSSPLAHTLIFINKAVFKWAELFVEANNANKEDTRKFLLEFTKDFTSYGFDSSQIESYLGDLFFDVAIIGGKK